MLICCDLMEAGGREGLHGEHVEDIRSKSSDGSQIWDNSSAKYSALEMMECEDEARHHCWCYEKLREGDIRSSLRDFRKDGR
jgi:hypothetical protein